MIRTRLDLGFLPLLVHHPPDLLLVQLPGAGVGVLLKLHVHHRSRSDESPVDGDLEYISIVVPEACPENSPQCGWSTKKAASAFLVQFGPTIHIKDTCH